MKATFVLSLALAALVLTASPRAIAGARPPVNYSDPARAIADLFVGGPYLNAPTDFQVRTIRKAQQNLRDLGYFRGRADGMPSAALTQALVLYQRENRFRATGRLDKVTLQALDLLYTSQPY